MKKLLSLLLIFLSLAVGAQPPPPTGLSSGTALKTSVAGLHVVGNLIVNNLGQSIQLRGVNINGPDYECNPGGTPGQVFDPASGAPNNIPQMQAWGINVVRLTLNEHCWLNVSGVATGGTAYINPIVSYIQALNAANIAVILDDQFTAPGTQIPCNTQPMPNSDYSVSFWSSVAGTTGIKNNLSVIFDLFNEPWPDGNSDTPVAWQCLQQGGSVCGNNGHPIVYSCGGPSVPYTAVGMQALVTAIRGAGANNIIDVPGIQFTNILDQWQTYEPTDTLSPPQLAAGWHSYNTQICNPQSCWELMIAPILQTTPVIAEEIGENDCQDVFVAPLMSWLDAHQGNYLAWAWNTYDCANQPALLQLLDGTPTSYGIGVRNHLLTVTGQTPPPPPVIPFFNNGVFPFGIAVGRATNYTSVGGTVYYGDRQTLTGLTTTFTNPFSFPITSTTAAISGTSDQPLYQTGRYGVDGLWVVNVPNGTYTVTLGVAPYTAFTQSQVDNPATASANNTGEYGQNQAIQGTNPCCVWSNFIQGGPGSPYSDNPPNTGYGTIATPAVLTVGTVPYTVNVYNQQLSIQISASFGANCVPPGNTVCGNRQTMLNSILIQQGAPLSVPTAPTGLTATGANSMVNLSWNSTATATYYVLLRATSSRGSYVPIQTLTSGTTYTDTQVTNGVPYYYVVQAANGAGVGPPSATVSGTPSVQVPAVPTGLAASSGNTTVSLTWNPSANATSYQVRRSTTSGTGYATIASPATAFYNDTGLTNGTTYYYVVAATNSAGTSLNSAEVSATPSVPLSGTWANVTPSNVNLTSNLDCGNFGTETMQTDAGNPSNLYSQFMCQGVWKSTDYGQTWTGPINTGTNGVGASGAGGFAVGSPGSGQTPVLYMGTIRGSAFIGTTNTGTTAAAGFWTSVDGGVTWTNFNVGTLPDGQQDVYPPVVDPYNYKHLLMTGHEQGWIGESTDGGHTWTSIAMNSGMKPGCTACGSSFIAFVNTGAPGTPGNHSTGATANTWLWINQDTGGTVGTWRTNNGGGTWTQVDKQEHGHGTWQNYQTGSTGVIYDPGDYTTETNGSTVIRSTDYGQTWAAVGVPTNEAVAIGTSNDVYAAFGWAAGLGVTVSPNFELTAQPGTGTWTQPATPSNMNLGFAQFALTNTGANNVLLSAQWGGGIWRYVEPEPATTGVWTSVTPAGIDLTNNLDCGNFGTKSVSADVTNPGVVYTLFHCQGVWKSTDYGLTWVKVSTGTNGAIVGDAAGNVTVVGQGLGVNPIVYAANIRSGSLGGVGFWKSTNGGVDWVQESVAPAGGLGQQFYSPVIDPYNQNHLLMAGHAVNQLQQSTDGGVTWTAITPPPQYTSGGTWDIEFINTGNAGTTATTWLAANAPSGGVNGTWRTTNSGSTWTKVDNNEHATGEVTLYQPDTSGVVYIAGLYSASGFGVLRSTNYGQTWTHFGANQNEGIVFGTKWNVYSMFGSAPGPPACTNTVPPALQIAQQPGTGTWSAPGTPAGYCQGPAAAAVMPNGSGYVILTANYNSGLWRYVEP